MVAERQQHLDSLPRYATSFIGRAAEQAELIRLLGDPGIRLITLIGPGGVGKTRLAIETIRRNTNELEQLFSDGVLFVDMSPVATSDRALATLSAALELPELEGEELREAVSEALANREMLLILDNLEHIVEGGALLAAIAGSCTGIKLLATSRTALRVSGEQRFVVPLLSSEETGTGVGHPGDALSLYEARAKEVLPGFVLDDRTLPVVRKICQKLDGLPLAIELAVPRLRVISNEALLARLENRLQVLDRGPVDAISRHRTLDATIDWSAQFLTPDLLRVFLRLSIIPDTFSLDAVEAIGGSVNPLDDITALVDQALVQPIIADPSTEPRFRMLATVREYASNRLREIGAVDEAEDGLISFCVELAERSESLLTGSNQSVHVEKLNNEFESTRLALDLTVRRTDRDDALRIIAASWRFWFLRGNPNEGRMWIDQAIADRPPSGTPLWAKFLYAAAIIAEAHHDYEQASRWIEQALELFKQHENHLKEARCWIELGHIAGDTGRYEYALDCYERSTQLGIRAGDLRTEVVARCGSANVENRRGHDEAAARHYALVIPMMKKVGDELGWATLLGNYGVVLARQGKFAEATKAQEESLVLSKKIGSKVGVAMALINLHEVNYGGGDYLVEALTIAREVNTAELTNSVLVNLAEEAAKQQNPKSAAEYLEEAIEVAESSQMPAVVSETLDHIAQLVAGIDPSRATRVVAGSAVIRSTYDIHWTGGRGHAQEELVKSLSARLGPEKFAAEMAVGSSMTQDQIVVEARAGLTRLSMGVEPKQEPQPEAKPTLHDLTRREVDVLRQIALGASDREIGNTLFISPKTANHHVTRILSKLGCTTRAAAAAIAVRNGIV